MILGRVLHFRALNAISRFSSRKLRNCNLGYDFCSGLLFEHSFACFSRANIETTKQVKEQKRLNEKRFRALLSALASRKKVQKKRGEKSDSQSTVEKAEKKQEEVFCKSFVLRTECNKEN